MYQEYYGFSDDPFRLSPDHHYCFRHPTFSKARAYMEYAVHRAEGFVMITGRPGTGKTTLIEDLLSQIEGKEVMAATLVSAQLEADDLVRMVAFNFGIAAKNHSKAEILMEMQGVFANFLADGKRPLLVIDEAQSLSIAALEELRLLTNLRINSQPMLQIFLVGQDELKELVLAPGMEQLHQRMIATCHLAPLDFKQTATYVMHRLKVAGWRGNPMLKARLFNYLYSFSLGVPRRINLFMSRLMLHGALEEKRKLDEEDAIIILDELKSEHLAPVRSNELFDRPISTSPEHEIDEKLLMPDQKIGAKLIKREQASSRAQPRKSAPVAQSPVVPSAASAAVPRQNGQTPPAATQGATQRAPSPAPPAQRPQPQESAVIESRAQPPSDWSAVFGLASGLILLLVVLGLALLVVPVRPDHGEISGKLWRLSGIATVRAQLFEWSGGAVPVFTSPGTTVPAANESDAAPVSDPVE